MRKRNAALFNECGICAFTPESPRRHAAGSRHAAAMDHLIGFGFAGSDRGDLGGTRRAHVRRHGFRGFRAHAFRRGIGDFGVSVGAPGT